MGQACFTPASSKKFSRASSEVRPITEVTEGLPPTSTPSPAGWLEGPGVGIVSKLCQERWPRTHGSYHSLFPCCLCLKWSCTLEPLAQTLHLCSPRAQRPTHTPPHPPPCLRCLFAGRGTCGCLASGCSMDSHGQSRDVHPLGEEC